MNKEDGKKLADEMVKYILTKKPSDLTSGHDGVWYSHLSALGMGVRCSIGAVTKWRELSREE